MTFPELKQMFDRATSSTIRVRDVRSGRAGTIFGIWREADLVSIRVDGNCLVFTEANNLEILK